jgi:hypothetical protein
MLRLGASMAAGRASRCLRYRCGSWRPKSRNRRTRSRWVPRSRWCTTRPPQIRACHLPDPPEVHVVTATAELSSNPPNRRHTSNRTPRLQPEAKVNRLGHAYLNFRITQDTPPRGTSTFLLPPFWLHCRRIYPILNSEQCKGNYYRKS